MALYSKTLSKKFSSAVSQLPAAIKATAQIVSATIRYAAPVVSAVVITAAALHSFPAAAQEEIGTLRQKTLSEVHNDLHIGCEALDRGYADYDAYKSYLEPLGMRYIRIQAGWARCERKKGVYNFKWLDRIINDAVSRGLEPWLETSYGNPIYKGGGTAYIDGGWPTSDEALHAWDNWVRSLAERYKGKVHTWEIWNEPDELLDPYAGKVNGKHQYKPRREGAFEELVDLQIRTASIIKETDPDAVIASCGLARLNPSLIDELVTAYQAAGKEHLFDYITYHGYKYRPEDMYPLVAKMQEVLDRHNSTIKLWQGESGAPSRANSGGALRDYQWSEISQAKWDLRRILGDKGRGIRSGLYTIVDHNYARSKAAKGLLETNEFHQVIGEKQAYGAMRNLVSIYDLLDISLSSDGIDADTDGHISKFLFKDRETGVVSAVLWLDENRPDDNEEMTPTEVRISGTAFEDPVAVDLRTGKIYRIDADGQMPPANATTLPFNSQAQSASATTPADIAAYSQTLTNIPLYDSPVLITELSAIM